MNMCEFFPEITNCVNCEYFDLREINSYFSDFEPVCLKREEEKRKELSMINQEDVAKIMNAVNDAINDFGYTAVGYENTHMFLNIIIEPNNLVEEE